MAIRSWVKSALWGGSLGFQAVLAGSLLLPLLNTVWYRVTSSAPPEEFGGTEAILGFGTVAVVVLICAAIPGTLGGMLLGLAVRLAMLWRYPLPPLIGGILGAALGSAAGLGAYFLVLRLLGVVPPRPLDSLASIVLGLSLVIGGLAGAFLTWVINQEQKRAV